jgi:hypothetical protein
MFLFENDLSFVNKKTHLNKTTNDKKMKKNKKIGMLTRNDKIQQEIIGVLKIHIGNTKGVKLNMKNFLFQAIEGIKTLKIEGIGHNVEEH